MTKKKYLKVFVIVLIVFALIYVSSCGFLLYNQIDKTLLANIEGEYDDGNAMCLTIIRESGKLLDDDTTDPYFEIIDVEAANPGVEGKIIYLDEDTIIIKIDKFFFFELPNPNWKASFLNSILKMHYVKSGDTLILENNGEKEEYYDSSNGYEMDDDIDDAE